ncbi:enterochelin esterase-like enzyme [Saliterribacillus persicus]|uniref:Enterochelin esterase-like enzyme n=2 Tax=Saliterribacillus persicus TaxID=930114 RepID=A0A368XPH9_9BACI|nr:enterochelin esterase-like enzyme [Saliterribacillus persicus]
MGDARINSDYLQEEVEIKWYLPETFTPLKDYYVCIMQDGNDYLQMGRVATLSDELQEEMLIEPTIFVGIHYQNKFDRQEKYHPNGEKQEAYIKFLVCEVLPFLEEELHIQTLPAHRALMGDSLAGTLALMVAMRYPNTFGKVIMQSPFVNETVEHAVHNCEDLDKLTIFHSINEAETAVTVTSGETLDFLKPNRELSKILAEKVDHYTYKEYAGEHTWKYWQRDLREILISVFGEEF